METSIQIPLSKGKLYWMIVCSIIFILLGILLFLKVGDIEETNVAKIYVIKIAAVLVVPLCCWSLYYATKKIKDTEAGLSITPLGIYDNSSGLNLRLLKWIDIKGFKEYDNRRGTKSLVVLLHNPKEYINRANGFWAKKLLQANYKLAGTPVFISAISLKISYDELKDFVLIWFEKYKGENVV